MALVTARRIARRNMIRRSSWLATLSATRRASSSGLRISSTPMFTGQSIIRATSRRSLSMSSPFLPITMPGRAVWTTMRALRAGRRIWMWLTEAWASRRRM